jgi:hypothetical protein
MSVPRCNGYATHLWGEEYDRNYDGHVQHIQVCERAGCTVTKYRSKWNPLWDCQQKTYATWYKGAK